MLIQNSVLETIPIRSLQDAVYLNIETTGLSARNSFICMIGIGRMVDDHFQHTMFLADNRRDEAMIMEGARELISQYDKLVTYGGHSFSYHFLNDRWDNYHDDVSFFPGNLSLVDLQHMISPYKAGLPVADLKKKTMESFLGFDRSDSLIGKEIVKLYSKYELTRDKEAQDVLINHGDNDMLALICFSKLYNYALLFKGELFENFDLIKEDASLSVRLKLRVALPFDISYRNSYMQLDAKGLCATICIPIFDAELKYFLPGPVKDYYYLPMEDRAIHHSVASFVDREYRKKATAATCYTRIQGEFLPSKKTDLYPTFKTAYNEKTYYIRYDSQDWLKDKARFIKYLKSLIE